jgi:ubiquinone/menaquinone biosynthesis C-methylase UbiE
MNESEKPPYTKTYDSSRIQAGLKRIESNPKLIEKFNQGALNRAKDVFLSGELRKYIFPQNKVLDIGAGSGHIAQIIEQETKARVIKLDLADLRTNMTKDDHFVIADAHSLPFKDKAVDVATLIDILHHCRNQERIIKEAKRVVKPKGKIIIIEDTLPEITSPIRRKMMFNLTAIEDDFFNNQPRNVNPHLYHSISQWQELFRKEGFKPAIYKTWYWGLWDFVPEKIKPNRNPKWTVGRPFECTCFILNN